MEPKSGSVCSNCGWEEGSPPTSPIFLPPRTVLDGRYLIGNVLGAGGFGITYLAWDLNLGCKRAIKEYFPNAHGSRTPDHCTVVASSVHAQAAFEHGRQKFLEEGQALAKFQDHPGIVSVVGFFKENGTSYLVMKYEQGITFQQYLRQEGGRIDFETALGIVKPVMDTLRAVHRAKILHRDISPDNIFINDSHQVKLLDFGSAKHDMASETHTQQITLKRGYSPEEQYRTSGKQGPATDVYALGATIYQALTGQVPPESLDRLEQDTLQSPSQLGVRLPKHADAAVMRAMAVRAGNRFQTMLEFQEAISGTQIITTTDGNGRKVRTEEKQKEEEQSHRVRTSEPVPPRIPWWQPLVSRIQANRVQLLTGGAVALGVICVILLARVLLLAPQVSLFSAEPRNVEAGQTVTLRWSVEQGTATIDHGIGRLQENRGSQQVSPSSTTTYTLTARRLLRSVTRSVTVSVRAVIPVESLKISFNAEPLQIRPGTSSELSWSVSGSPTSVTLEPGIGPVRSVDHVTVTPTATTTYTLKAERGGQVVESPLTVQVVAVVKPSASLKVEPATIRPGESATLQWQVTGDVSSVSLDHGLGMVQRSGRVTITPSSTSTYTLMARLPNEVLTRSATVTVKVPEPPRIESFVAKPTSIQRGQSATLAWSVSGEVGAVSIDPEIGTVSATGNYKVTPPASVTYRLTAKGPGGGAVQVVTVEVNQPRTPPVIGLFSVSPQVIGRGQSATLQWSVAGELSAVTLQPDIGPVSARGVRTVSPASSTMYTLTARGPGGNVSRSATVEVSTEPFGITRFTVKPGSIHRGESAEISWSVSGAVTGLGIDPDVGPLNTKTGARAVQPTKTTTYVLTAKSGSQILTKTVKLKVR
jgi:serine/threonine protein kinase